MAFSVKERTNLFNINEGTTQMTLDLTKNPTSKWIYCNFPEAIPTNGLGDSDKGNHYLNQVVVEAGTHHIFYSYYNAMATPGIVIDKDGNEKTGVVHMASGATNFGIQLFNPNASSMTVQVNKYGYHDGTMDDPQDATISRFDATAGVPWREYFNSTAQNAQTIISNGSYWLCDEAIPVYSNSALATAFCGVIEFTVSAPAIITVYAYHNKWAIDGNATAYPAASEAYPNISTLQELGYDIDETYSGYGTYNGYETTSPIVLLASDLANGSIFFKTNYSKKYKTYPNRFKINGIETESDSIGLTLAHGGTIDADTVGENLGNWGALYKINLKLINDTDEDHTFYGYVKCDPENVDQFPVIRTDADAKYTRINCINSSTTTDKELLNSATAYAWRWLEQVVPSNSTFEGTYYYTLGTNSTHGVSHIFSLKWFDYDLFHDQEQPTE